MTSSSPQPPASARAAIRLTWAGAGLSVTGILMVLLQKDAIRHQAEARGVYDVDGLVNLVLIVGVVFGLVGTGLWVWMAIMNGKGRPWARIVATVFGGLYIAAQLITYIAAGVGVGYGANVDGEPVNAALQITLGVCTLAVATLIIVLMWQSSSSAWYEAKERARQVAPPASQPQPLQMQG
ncbi:MAG: hypothetical protein QOG15_3641 [Solirubrobacteraceae bacterium]|nr:hypothetical protein [Solirubrobacteraceae bacterium]